MSCLTGIFVYFHQKQPYERGLTVKSDDAGGGDGCGLEVNDKGDHDLRSIVRLVMYCIFSWLSLFSVLHIYVLR